MKTTRRLSNLIFGIIFSMLIFATSGSAGTFSVINTNDSGFGSLRQAMLDANNSSDLHNKIEFIISGSGTRTINLQSPLPTIKPPSADCGFGNTLLIDGTTMSGYAGVPLVELNGTNAGAANGLKVVWGIVTVKGLSINRFALWGIHVKHDGADHNPQCAGDDPPFTTLELYGSRIGTDPSGTLDRGNGAGGVYVDGNMTAYIGGVAANQGNVISGNTGDGVELEGQSAYVQGNMIGTNSSGTAVIANSFNGLKARGGWLSIYDNVISGNGIDGLQLSEMYRASNGPISKIQGNRIGTNNAGTVDLGNVANGINFSGFSDETVLIGGNLAWMANVISGNDQNGIKVNAERAYIKGNLIGTNAAGTSALPNLHSGVYMVNRHSIVGGIESGEGNTISGNGGNGVRIEVNDDGYNADVVGNRIGTNLSGTAAIPNDNSGVTVSVNTLSSFGEEVRIRQNVISGNTDNGVSLTDGAFAVEVANNYIGTNAANANLGNGGDGVNAFATAEDSIIANNVIAYNSGDGVGLQPGFGGTSSSRIKIAANSIYLNAGLGIDLGPTNGVTPNDLGDADNGPNGLQNFPIVQTATTTTLSGSLNSTPNMDFEIHFYRTDVCDASGNGEGRFYLGMVGTTSNASGNATFTGNFALSAGQIVVATATAFPESSIYGSTSEFSQCKSVIQTQPGNFVFGAATFNVNEGNGSLILGVNRTGGSDGTVTVNYATSNGTAIAGQDYTTTSGTLTFTAGQTVKNVTIPITNDPSDEPNQDFTIALSAPTGGANTGNPGSAVVTIIDNDNPPTISIDDVSVVEGNENLTTSTFAISLSNASAFPTAVSWATAPGGTATVGVDYQANSGTVNFAAGETTKQVTVQVYGETLVEINEAFNVNLSSPTMATIGDGTGIGTILDDDNPGKFSFSLAPYNVSEAGGSATVTVIRTGGDAGTATVDYATSGGTATPFADFTPASGTLVFLDGETQKTFTVPILEDQIAEQTESVNLNLSSPTGGATLGVAAAIINILDNDSGTPLSISGGIKKSDNSPLAGATVNLTGTHTATTATDANGEFSFSSLTPAGSYAVTPSAIGYTFTPINHQYANLAASVTNARFTATPAPSRALRVVGADTVPGQLATAIVEIVAQGDENTVGFSLNFDPAVLSNPQVALIGAASAGSLVINDSQAVSGKLGVIIALPAGQVFAAGTRQLASVTFSSAQTNLYSTPLDLIDVPVQKQIVNVNADPLPAVYTNGAITFAQGYESDVAPRPTGTMNGTVTVADFTQIGRFVAGLNAPDQTNEFQRADVAPRISKGNGLLTVSDYTQAGRYAAGLDPVQTAGGAATASLAEPEASLTGEALSPEAMARTVSVTNAQGGPGQQVFVPVKIESQGNENGFGFSLSYDATKLSNPVVSLGTDTPAATLIPNTTQTGKVGVLLGLPAGTSLSMGVRHIVTVRFDVQSGAAPGVTPLTFGDQPIAREVVDADVNVLTTGYTDGSVDILGPTAANVTIGGRVTDAWGRGIANAMITMSDADGVERRTTTGSFGLYHFEGVESGQTYIVTVHAKRHQFDPASRTVTILDEITNLDFTAQPANSVTDSPKEER